MQAAVSIRDSRVELRLDIALGLLATLGPKVYTYDLLWAIWSTRVGLHVGDCTRPWTLLKSLWRVPSSFVFASDIP